MYASRVCVLVNMAVAEEAVNLSHILTGTFIYI